MTSPSNLSDDSCPDLGKYCSLQCPMGYERDDFGCEVCECSIPMPKCRPLTCTKTCPYGYVWVHPVNLWICWFLNPRGPPVVICHPCFWSVLKATLAVIDGNSVMSINSIFSPTIPEFYCRENCCVSKSVCESLFSHSPSLFKLALSNEKFNNYSNIFKRSVTVWFWSKGSRTGFCNSAIVWHPRSKGPTLVARPRSQNLCVSMCVRVCVWVIRCEVLTILSAPCNFFSPNPILPNQTSGSALYWDAWSSGTNLIS